VPRARGRWERAKLGEFASPDKSYSCVRFTELLKARPAYTSLVRGGIPSGLATDDGVALHFVDGALHRVLSSRPAARAYRVELRGDDVVDEPIEPEFLVPAGRSFG
jgi:hypothetical protein